MPAPLRPFPESHNPEVRAFVLRVRPHAASTPQGILVQLEDVASAQRWNFTSLDGAVAQIQSLLKMTDDPQQSHEKPH